MLLFVWVVLLNQRLLKYYLRFMLKGPFYKAKEDELEHDEWTESIDEMRQSYQNYLHRLSH